MFPREVPVTLPPHIVLDIPQGISSTYSENAKFETSFEKNCPVEILFSGSDRPPAPILYPGRVMRVFRPEAGEDREIFDPWAHCEAPVVPEQEISPQLHTGNTAQSQPGDARAAGACLHAPKSVRIIQRISYENRILLDRKMGVETPIPPIMIYAAAPGGAPPRRIRDWIHS